MKEHPILFSAEMIRALLEKRKWQTRRLKGLEEINISSHDFTYVGLSTISWAVFLKDLHDGSTAMKYIKCPYQIGDHLWCKEALYCNPDFQEAGYMADESPVFVNKTIGDMLKWRWKRDTLAALYMPREASRLTLEVTGIRAERLQDITEEDAIAEGITSWVDKNNIRLYKITGVAVSIDFKTVYATLWDKLYAKRGYPWSGNWWVWVYSFVLTNLPCGDILK